MRTAIIFASVVALSSPAFAGFGSSAVALKAAVQSGSVDAIVSELEKAEELPSQGAISVVLPLVDHDSYRVRDAAGWWLTRRGVRTQVLANMTARLSGSDPVAARNAGDVLAAMRDVSVLPALSSYLAKPLDEDSGIAVARAIGAIGNAKGVTALNTAFSSSLAGVRAQAVASVRDLRAPRGTKVAGSVAAVVPLLSDADANVRRQAAITIGFLGGNDTAQAGAAVQALSSMVTGDPAAVVRKAAAWALGELKDGTGRAALMQAQANDSDAFVRSIASAALANLR
ncbi:MAG TPA: HEAT repeat domain-containing protein [Polyangia bacterium]|nr:HEAT repeat domain-containing protein [Polyangia bacterium]